MRIVSFSRKITSVSTNGKENHDYVKPYICVCLATTILSAALLCILLIIGGIESNPGPTQGIIKYN